MAHPMNSFDDAGDASSSIPMFSKNGTALTEDERERIAQKRGQCLRCGIKTKDIGVFKQKSITSDQVHKGVCIRCNPEKVPEGVYREWEAKFRPAATKLSQVGKFRAAARATAFAIQHSPSRDQQQQQSSRQVAGSKANSTRHASLLQSPGRGQLFDGSMSMSALHSSAPASTTARPQFDQTTGSFRYSGGSKSERSQPQFDGNLSLNALRATLPEARSHRASDGSMMASAREGMGTSERLSSHHSYLSMSERTTSQPIEEEEEEQVAKPAPSRETSSARLPRASPPKKDSSHRHQHKESDGGSSSWLNYDHDLGNASAGSFAASDYSGGESTEDLGQLVKSIKENRKHPEVLMQKLHRLRNLADSDGDTIPAITDVLNEYRNDPHVLTAAAGALWSVTAEKDEKKAEAADRGAVDCILDSLRNSQTQEDAEFVEWSIGLLACLARGKGNREKIGHSNGVETILDTLRVHQSSAGVFEWSCRALHALVHQYGEEGDTDDAIRRNIVSIEENEGVAVIVSAMKVHYSESIAQGWALKLLLRLMDHEDGAAVNNFLSQVNEAEGIAACVKVLKARSTSPQVLSLTAELLANLFVEAEGDKNSEALQSALECIPSLVRVMKDHDGDEKVQESCCRLFAKLSMNEKARPQIKESKALVDIVYAMMKYTAKLTLHEAGSWTLWTMSSFPAVFSLSYAKDALSALNTSTKEFANVSLLLAGACGFVANVSSATEANMAQIPVEIPIRALKVNDPTGMVDEQACRALTGICIRAPTKIAVIFEGGGIDLLVKRLRSQSLKASAAACKALSAMANTNDEIRRSVVDAGALDAALTLLGNLHSTECVEEAMELIAVLLAWEKKRQSVKLPNDTVSVILEKIESSRDTPPLLAKACDAILNVLLATGTGSKSLDFDGLIDSMLALLDDKESPVEVKQNACTVLWALVTKQKTKKEEHLTAMFQSVLSVMKTYKGEDKPFNADLQSAAAGALSYVTTRLHDTAFPINSDDVDGIIAVMYMTMEYDRERTELLEKLLSILFNLSLANGSLVIQCGGIVVVIDAMVDNEKEESILESGCAILGLLSSTEDLQVNLCIAETDGIDMIISALASFPSNERIQVSACMALSHLSGDNESREMIVSQGGLMLIINAINSNRENVDLLEGALSALLNLSTDTDEQVLADNKVTETAIEAMRYNEDVSKVQTSGMGVLQNLSMRGSEGKREIARLGGIKVLVEAISSFMGEAEVLERAFTTMWSLALLDSNQKSIAKAGGVELVVNGMMAQLDSAGVQKQACGCLCTLSTDSRNNALIREADGVDAIVYAMWAHFDSEVVLCEACRALSSVVVDMHTNEVIIAQEGEVSAVISAMRCYPQSAKLQENACLALRNLLLSPESVDSVRFLGDEIKAVVSTAASRFPDECLRCAKEVLGQLQLG